MIMGVLRVGHQAVPLLEAVVGRPRWRVIVPVAELESATDAAGVDVVRTAARALAVEDGGALALAGAVELRRAVRHAMAVQRGELEAEPLAEEDAGRLEVDLNNMSGSIRTLPGAPTLTDDRKC